MQKKRKEELAMKRIGNRATALLCSMALTLGLVLPGTALAAQPLSVKEQYIFGGAATQYYVEESYYAAPVVADLDGDGALEVLNAAYSLTVMDAATGAIKWRINAGRDRATPYALNQNPAGKVFCDFVVRDIDGDAILDIVITYEDGSISALDNNGYFKPGFPQRPTTGSIRALHVEDVNRDGKCEIIVGAGVESSASVWMYSAAGVLMPGWPQLSPAQDATASGASPSSGYSYGIFANGISSGNLDSDPALEIVVPTDTAYTVVYNPDGSLMPASSIYGERPWGRVALYEDYAQEQLCENEGWGWPIEGTESRAELYRAELGHSAAVCTDVNGDGKLEVVLTALMTDRTSHTQTNHVKASDTRYMTVGIFNADRSRFQDAARGYNWEKLPIDLVPRLRQVDPVSMATGLKSEPVCVDLDGDGQQEILFSSYNGLLHCYKLDGKQFGNWPFRMPQTSASVYEYASTPTYADLNGDGKQEVIFASWTQNETSKNTGTNGALYITDYQGNLLSTTPLPNGYATYEGVVHNSNNVTARPLVRDIDGDGQLEILLNTTYRGLCVYEVNGGLATPTAVPTVASSSAALRVDGKEISLQTYLLADSNYVKLRDVAALLTGTKAQFEVTWSKELGIGIEKDRAYTPVGGELVSKGEGAKPYTAGEANLAIGGVAKALSVCSVENNNYFKLRDLGEAIGFSVDWDAASKTVIIQTTP